MSQELQVIEGPNLPVVVPPEAPPVPAEDAPARVAGVGLAVSALFFVGFLGWATFARLDAAALGNGQVTVAGNRQTVQHRDGGIVSALLVRDGQHVEAGQVLIELSGAEVRAQERSLADTVINLEAQKARLEAELAGAAIAWPASFAGYEGEDRGMADRAMRLQRSQLATRGGSLSATTGVLRQQQAEIGQQIGGFAAQAEAARRQRLSMTEQLENTRKLEAQGYASANVVRQLERGISQLDASVADYSARAAAAREQIGSMSGQMIQSRRRYSEDSATILRDTQFQLNEMRPKWLAAQDQLRRVLVRAPAAGQVVELKIFTRGGVIEPGAKILDIVPDAAPLVVRAQFSPSDIDGVVAGRVADVKFLSIHDRDLPILKGAVRTVSADSLRDESTGLQFFSAEVTVPRSQIAILSRLRGGDTGIRPGVPVQVTVPLRKRTALQYMLEPLTATFYRSFRER